MTDTVTELPRLITWGLELASPATRPDGPIRTISGVPGGLGPTVVRAQTLRRDNAPSSAVEALSPDASVVFQLVGGPGGTAGTMADAVPTAALAELGSTTLPDALAACDLPAVLEALAFDVVVVPVAPGPDGALATRVFLCDDLSPHRAALSVFSSAATLAAFLDDDASRGFWTTMRPGVSSFGMAPA